MTITALIPGGRPLTPPADYEINTYPFNTSTVSLVGAVLFIADFIDHEFTRRLQSDCQCVSIIRTVPYRINRVTLLNYFQQKPYLPAPDYEPTVTQHSPTPDTYHRHTIVPQQHEQPSTSKTSNLKHRPVEPRNTPIMRNGQQPQRHSSTTESEKFSYLKPQPSTNPRTRSWWIKSGSKKRMYFQIQKQPVTAPYKLVGLRHSLSEDYNLKPTVD